MQGSYTRKYELGQKLTNLETNNSYRPSKCMSFTGTWLQIRSASNLLVKMVPIFWIPINAFLEGSCTGTNAGHKLQHQINKIKQIDLGTHTAKRPVIQI